MPPDFSINKTSPRRTAVLALLCLLFAAALQVGEVSHQHAADDAAQHCLLCKVDAGHVVTDNPQRGAILSQYRRLLLGETGVAAPENRLLPPLRGPPVHT